MDNRKANQRIIAAFRIEQEHDEHILFIESGIARGNAKDGQDHYRHSNGACGKDNDVDGH